MLAAALLQTATDEYRDAGLKEERDRTRILMQQKIGAAGENLQSFEHKIEITHDDMEKFEADRGESIQRSDFSLAGRLSPVAPAPDLG
jgi:hypothetical protein